MKKILSLMICFQMLALPVFAEYDFSDEAQAEFDRAKYQQLNTNDYSKKRNQKEIKTNKINPDTNNTQQIHIDEYQSFEQPKQKQLNGYVVKVPAGTTFNVTFDSGISSGSLEKDDRLTVRLAQDLKYNGVLIAPSGSLVYGTATDAEAAGYAYGSGSIELNFNEILTPDGSMIKISTEKIYLKAESERAQKMTRDIVVGALGSMLIGAALTALGGGGDWGRNMMIFGGIGAVGGGLRGTMQRGTDIQISDGTTLQVKLAEPLSASQYNY